MFEDYKRLTDREDGSFLCTNCPRFSECTPCDIDYCEYELGQRLAKFENALEDGRLIELTEERVTALMACLHGTLSNRRVMIATYTKFKRTEDGKREITHQMPYEEAVGIVNDMLESLSDKKEETEK